MERQGYTASQHAVTPLYNPHRHQLPCSWDVSEVADPSLGLSLPHGDKAIPQNGGLLRSWRNNCIPFQQTWPILACALTSALLVILISIYCTNSDRLANGVNFSSESSSRAIFVLSVLSGLNGIFIAATISGVIQRLQWLLIAQPEGTNFLRVLSLDASTGIASLFQLGFGWALPLLSTIRASGVIRLATLALVPVLGVLIMSNVNTKMQFSPLNAVEPVLGWGMKPFNGSLANYISVVSSQLINGLVLGDTGYALDITDSADLAVLCGDGPLNAMSSRCRRTYVVPGGIDNAVKQFGNTSPTSDYFLAQNQQSLILDFLEGEPLWSFKDDECGIFGFPFCGFSLCLKNVSESSLQSRK